jgi:hypothetical protein
MFDPLPTQFSEVQRVSYRGIVGQTAYDRQTYEVLCGDGSEAPQPKRRLTRRTAVLAGIAAVPVLIGLALRLLLFALLL